MLREGVANRSTRIQPEPGPRVCLSMKNFYKPCLGLSSSPEILDPMASNSN